MFTFNFSSFHLNVVPVFLPYTEITGMCGRVHSWFTSLETHKMYGGCKIGDSLQLTCSYECIDF
uniref:Uncharacterized protein n=1 Tax=Anguilla anguilla TaxID=7936 RepID=A0A0E9REN9_ANGAN